jgi:steroid delta-isomerase-like uncharacterized protein
LKRPCFASKALEDQRALEEVHMTTNEASLSPAEIARATFDAVAKHDLDAAMSHVAPTCTDDFVALGEFRGAPAIRQFFDEMLTAFPDFDITVDRVVADGSAAVVQWNAHGTFSGGQFQGVEPTRKRVDLRGVDVMEVADGLVQHNTIYYDGASFARQVGMLPRSGSSADKAVVSTFNAVTKLRRRVAERSPKRSA